MIHPSFPVFVRHSEVANRNGLKDSVGSDGNQNQFETQAIRTHDVLSLSQTVDVSASGTPLFFVLFFETQNS